MDSLMDGHFYEWIIVGLRIFGNLGLRIFGNLQ